MLTGTGGITEHLGAIVKLLEKDTGAVVCSNSDPVALLDELEQVYRERVLPQHRAALEGRDPDGELEE
ncbi:MAG: hypothetical protein FJ313_07035 [Gemmatimonadetes bacterium]|nr:hypothetical protein [Gemmatimonadota bacterium]